MTISIASRQQIRQRASFLCEYCHSSEEASASLFTKRNAKTMKNIQDSETNQNLEDDLLPEYNFNYK